MGDPGCRWLPGLLLAGLAGVACSAAEPGSPDPEAVYLAERYIDGYLERVRLDARRALLPREIERLDGCRQPAWLAEWARSDGQIRQALDDVLGQGARPLADSLAEVRTGLRDRRASLRGQWVATRATVNDALFRRFDIEGSRQLGGRMATLFSMDKRWFWLGGMLAVGSLAAVVLHDRRRELRRSMAGGRTRTLGLRLLALAAVLLAGVALLLFLTGNRAYETLVASGGQTGEPPRLRMAAENAAVEAQVVASRAALEDLENRYSQALDRFQQRMLSGTDAGFWQQWQQTDQAQREARQEAAMLAVLPAAIKADHRHWEQLSDELAAQSEADGRRLRMQYWVRGGLGGVLCGFTALCAVFFYRGLGRRRRLTANTCPLCLGRNRLEIVASPSPSSNGRGPVRMVRCKNALSQHPYESCDYTFLALYRSMPKLCFPTLGVPQAGKTHWLSMLYWQLNRGNYPRAVQFERVKSRSSEDFDQVIEDILRSRIGTAATQRDRIPHPLVFSFRDRDRLGRSNVLVNIFDYSGEVTTDLGIEDYRRRRALEADGFLFFLDPTYPSEPQAKALADFREDLRVVKGVPAGRRVRVPVALCVSKIDLLTSQPYALPGGGDAIARFYEGLEQIDPSGESLAGDVLDARSRLLARLRDTIWPGWQIERQVEDLFGGRHLFFPLTPVGLEGLGEADLSLRTIAPFGLLEPLLWLLEMNGYPVLE